MTLIVYTLPNSKSCRHAIAFLTNNQVPFTEVKLKTELELGSLMRIASRVGDMDEIVSNRCLLYPAYETLIEKETTKMSDVFQFIIENPKLLKVPIMINEKAIQIGYNPDDIGTFLPRSVKKRAFLTYLEQARKHDRIVFVDDKIMEEEEVDVYAGDIVG